MKVVDQLRDGARGVGDRIAALPSSAGRAAGRARRTVIDLPARVSDRVRGDTPSSGSATAAPADGDGLIDRVRENPRYAIAIAAGGVLLIAWIAWAIYVTTENGATAGLGVVLSWPVLLGALILVALPIYGVFLLVRRIREGGSELGGSSATEEAPVDEAEEEEDEEDEEDSEEEDDDDTSAEAEEDDGDEDEEDEDEDSEEDEEDADTSAEAEEDEGNSKKSSKKAGSKANS